ncbi:MAG TPA: glutamine synthetase family protein [bacterium]|uniref:Glutamine synthetase n=1 Tax=candidate division TA06 bacterium ADurb.Bin417 TaxID=1852828 RepID=A0A1V5ML30_UNCT6|nr:MAG: Glutamine synthetase [candidate division TA06 bacterium ADurb.Bin417]HNQ35768.1 glutamine synthetase family protein [bacterium]HNS48732.1 glutamine synthetase family protein [bacterium]
MKEVEKVLKRAVDEKVKFVNLWFVDILGQLKSVTIRDRELEKALSEGIGFDGSSVEGFARIYESDLLLKPEAETFRILNWCSTPQERVAAFFCDILTPEGEGYAGDGRLALKRVMEQARRQGFNFCVGPELEYFYFKDNGSVPGLTDQGGYFDFAPIDLGSDLRQETVSLAEDMGIEIDTGHHEVAPSQHELDLRYGNALELADDIITVKMLTKEVARRHNLYASFMPKPVFGENGSGMHVHMSLFRGRENAFFDDRDPDKLSAVARGFAAGVLAHSREVTAICNQWVNSYKRLVPGYEAPVYIAWARSNRSSLVRIPAFKHGKPTAARIEFRSPDPACNPYLAFAVVLAAGLAGIEKGLQLPAPVEADIFSMDEKTRKRHHINHLPGSLIEAILETGRSRLVRAALGDHIFEKFIENKQIEWDRYRTQVTDYELKAYLPIL